MQVEATSPTCMILINTLMKLFTHPTVPGEHNAIFN